MTELELVLALLVPVAAFATLARGLGLPYPILLVLGGVLVGLAVGAIVAPIRRRLDDPPVEILISLLTPYAAYLPAERLGLSGVLAAAAAGLYLGRRAPQLMQAQAPVNRRTGGRGAGRAARDRVARPPAADRRPAHPVRPPGQPPGRRRRRRHGRPGTGPRAQPRARIARPPAHPSRGRRRRAERGPGALRPRRATRR